MLAVVGTGEFFFNARELGVELLIDRAVQRFHAATAERDLRIGNNIRSADSAKLLG